MLTEESGEGVATLIFSSLGWCSVTYAGFRLGWRPPGMNHYFLQGVQPSLISMVIVSLTTVSKNCLWLRLDMVQVKSYWLAY